MTRKNRQASWLLWLGFGGLLCLLAFAGLFGLSTLKTISHRNERIRADYLRRDRILQQIRADLYLSGTHIRDLLLEYDPGQAEQHRVSFRITRQAVDSNCTEYSRLVGPDQRELFDRFSAERLRYFEQLQHTLAWNTEERQTRGISFMKDVLLPERAFVVQMADQLSLANAHQLEGGSREVTYLFDAFDQNLAVLTAGCLLVGTLLAAFTAWRILHLEKITQGQLQELQVLSSRLVQVQESERRAIARELHDEVGQSISGLLLGIGNVAAMLPPEQHGPALFQLNDLRHLAERTVASVRNLSLLLRPSMLDDLGLVPALQWQAREISRTANISVQVAAEGVPEEDLSEETKTCIYRIVQEALNNAARHARATTVEVRLSPSANQILSLEITDNGRGFVPHEKGLGILGMEERVRQRRGTFCIQSEPGRGTTLLVHLPA
jgi:signal transduction histidine kinase